MALYAMISLINSFLLTLRHRKLALLNFIEGGTQAKNSFLKYRNSIGIVQCTLQYE